MSRFRWGHCGDPFDMEDAAGFFVLIGASLVVASLVHWIWFTPSADLRRARNAWRAAMPPACAAWVASERTTPVETFRATMPPTCASWMRAFPADP